ncbi:MAG: ABC transporter permease [Verrucomicrobiales bacterium]
MTELIRKEVRALVPMLWLAAFLALFPWIVLWALQFADQGGPAYWWSEENETPSDSAEFLQVLFIAIVSAAHGILLKEKDDGTLEFLDSLPTGRTRLFVAKAIALQAPVLIFGFTDFLATAAELWLSRTSLDPRWHAEWLLRGVGLVTVGGWAFAGIGLALGFLRRFAIMGLMLWYAVYLGLSESGVPWAEHLNLFAFAKDEYYGLDWLTPWREIRSLALTGAVAYGVAWLAWLGTGGATRLSSGSVQARTALAVIGTIGVVVSVIVATGLWMYSHWDELEEAGAEAETPEFLEATAVDYPEAPPFRMQTAHFDIIAPSALRPQAESLAAQADGILRQVSEFLQIPPPAGRLVADFTAESPHVLGLAGWKRVNLTLAQIPEGSEGQAVLGHELTHVFIDLGSGQKASDRFASTRWFHEGLASYLEHRFWRSEEETRIFRRAAAVAHHRDQSNFETLVDNKAFSQKFDPNLVYALGEAWCYALVRRHGDAAPGSLVRALATATPANPKATAIELWQAAMAQAGLEYAGVMEEYRLVLDAWVAQETEFIDSLPDLRPRLLTSDPHWIGIEAVSDDPLPEGARTVVLFRKQGGSFGVDYQSAIRRRGHTHSVPRDQFPDRELEVIVGLQLEPDTPAHFHEWVKLRTR